MIPLTAPLWQDPDWKKAMAESLRDPAELLSRLNLPADLLDGAIAAHDVFPLRVPQAYLERIEPGNPDDPLLRQILPLTAELSSPPGYLSDPVGDLAAMPVPGLLHKYAGRVLLITTAACAVHCRYCFRREFPYHATDAQWQSAIEYIAADASIHEVILSGGDPLSLSDKRLADLLTQLNSIPHLRRLRIHTRTPVMIPARITAEFLDVLQTSRLRTVMVLHVNHARELAADVRTALQRLTSFGISLLNQAVLLRGVNDSSTAQAELSEALFDAGVLPYYLHMLDQVQGAAHFAVADEQAQLIMEELRLQLPGYLVPRLAREVAGAPYKQAPTFGAL